MYLPLYLIVNTHIKFMYQGSYLPIVCSFPHGIPSFDFNATISSGLMWTKLSSATSETSFFWILVNDLIKWPVWLEALDPLANSIDLVIDLFLLWIVLAEHKSVGL